MGSIPFWVQFHDYRLCILYKDVIRLDLETNALKVYFATNPFFMKYCK